MRPKNTVKLLFSIVYPVSIRPMGPYTGTFQKCHMTPHERKNFTEKIFDQIVNSDREYVRQDPVHCLNHTNTNVI